MGRDAGRRSDSQRSSRARARTRCSRSRGNYTPYPLDLQATAVDQWNVSYQRQVAADWMVSANYIGSMTKHVWVDEPDQSGGLRSGRDDRGNHASTSRAESAEPRGRQVLRQHPAGRRRRHGELQRAAAVRAAAPRQRHVDTGATTPSRGASATGGTASRASPACRR